ncbi:MAG: hypothetical protein AB1333_00610 [Patescibacteria group bacterium]
MPTTDEYLVKTVKRIEKDKKKFDEFITTKPQFKDKKFFKEYRLGLPQKRSVVVQYNDELWTVSFGNGPGSKISMKKLQSALEFLLFQK